MLEFGKQKGTYVEAATAGSQSAPWEVSGLGQADTRPQDPFLPQSSTSSLQASKDSPLETYTPVDAMTEYLHDGVSSDLAMFPPHVSISIQEFDFGCCLPPRGAQPLPLCVTNHTKGTVAVAWTQRPERPFQVAPTTCDIPPLKSTAFRVTFQPPQPNALYAAELEGFAYYKVSEDSQGLI